jgi:hypothetical protein
MIYVLILTVLCSQLDGLSMQRVASSPAKNPTPVFATALSRFQRGLTFGRSRW